MKNTTREHILCAAIYVDDGVKRIHMPRNIKTGIVVCGWRHHNCFMILDAIFDREETRGATQGFLTSKDRFLNRGDSAEIAFRARQIEKPADTLISEDLY